MHKGLDPLEIEIVFFDGYCNLCNASVDYFLRNNNTENLYFSSLQGKLSKKLGLDQDMDSFVFWDKGTVYKSSSAIFALIPHVKSIGTKLLFPFKYFPRSISDFVYRQIARSRYGLFGKKETCRVASEEEKSRFLE